MHALVKKERRPGLWLEEIPVPEVGDFDVLIRTLRTSICGTDVHIFDWDPWAQRTVPVPMQIGHEFVGVIEAVGDYVIDFQPGMIATGEGHIVCGRCRNCLAGRRHLCNKTSGVGVNRPGAFAQFISIPQTNVWVADPNIPLDVISCFDPLGNAVHTALSFDVLGEDVLITGAGPIGIMAASVARHAGARYIVITDLNPYRLELAKSAGVTMAIDPSNLSLKHVMDELGMKEGFDVGLEMSGNPEALNSMLAAMCHGGKIAILGIQSKSAAIDWDLVVFNGLTIKGIYGREMYETWYKMTTMIQSGLNISPVITHRLPYKQFEEGFRLMKSGQSGKVVLHWSDLGAEKID
ncbi:MAG: L-threonine 3-dehydrogenase [Verrucomicrobia bacterium]|nr:L-threonine 3-dehydrogenase [Verrucomicrobiota bacterium]